MKKQIVNASYKPWCTTKNITDRDYDRQGKLKATIHKHHDLVLVWERGEAFDEIHVGFGGPTKFYN